MAGIWDLLVDSDKRVEAKMAGPLVQAKAEAERIEAFASAGITFDAMLNEATVTDPATGDVTKITVIDEGRMSAAERFVDMLRGKAK